MAFVGRRGSFEVTGLLVVPAPSFLDIDVDSDDDDGEVVFGIRPKSSPQPRRKSSVSDEDSEPEPPSLSGSRRVSFADAAGLSLVQVKEFDKWDVPQLPDFLYSKSREEEEYYIVPLNFSLSLSPEELLGKVQEQKVELEAIELLPGTTILKGVIRVLNVSFNKAVYVRTTLDNWTSHFDLLSEYIPGSSERQTDSFSFKLTLVPPFGGQGLKVNFCLRYETPIGTFWGNNNGRNYVLYCHKNKKEVQEKPGKEKFNKKSCLKTVSPSSSTLESMSSLEQENVAADMTQRGAEVNNENLNQSTTCPPGHSEEEGHTLQAENEQNCSRRNLRKAARMARVRDYFAQKDVKANGSESTALPETSREENQAEEYSDVQTLSKGNVKSEGTVIPADASLSNDSASKSKTEKCENINLADAATLTATADSPDDSEGLPHAEPAPAQHQNINRSVFTAERSQEPVRSYERTDPSGENDDSKGLVSNSSSYAFGTVVAPLYHQASGRAGSQSDAGNPLWASLRPPHTESHSSMSTSDHQDRDQRKTSPTQENNHSCTDTAQCSSTVTAQVENTLSVTSVDAVETLEDVNELENTEQIFRNTSLTQSNNDDHSVDILKSESLKAPEMSSNLKGEAQDGNLTCDLQVTLAHEAAQSQLPAKPRSHSCTKMNMAERVFETEAQESTFDLEKSCQNEPLCLSTQPTNTSDLVEELQPEHALSRTVDISLNHASSEEQNELDAHKKMPSPASCFETVKQKHVTKTESSMETGKMMSKPSEDEDKHAAEMEGVGEQSVTEVELNNSRTQTDMFIKSENKGILQDEEITVSEKAEQCVMETDATVMDIHLADAAEATIWEIMVEEEEESSQEFILQTDNEEEVDLSPNEVVYDTLDGLDKEMTLQEVTDKADMAEERNENEAQDAVEDKIRDVVNELLIQEQKTVTQEEDFELENDMQSDYTNDEDNEENKDAREQKVSEEKRMNVKESDECAVSKTPDDEDLPGFESSDITAPGKIKLERNIDEEACLSERLNITPHEAECKLSTPVNNVQDMTTVNRGNKNETNDRLEAVRDVNESTCAEGGLCTSTHDRISDHDSASDSGSEDEMELYMHCLRAVYGQQGSPRATKQPDQNKEFNGAKRLSITRSKLMSSSPMPCISESADEEQQVSSRENDIENVDVQAPAAGLSAPSCKAENISSNHLWGKETFSCRNLLKTLLYTTLLVIFSAVAYHYDFIACFGLYVISVVWLCCQGDRQHGKTRVSL